MSIQVFSHQLLLDHGLSGKWGSMNYNPISLAGALCDAVGPEEKDSPHEIMKGVTNIESGYALVVIECVVGVVAEVVFMA